MSASAPSYTAVVARLRAAGCVFAEDEARLLIAAAASPDDLAEMVDRRAGGQPLEPILGWAEFCGLRIAVDPGVFVPRRRTEFLVRRAAALAQRGAIVVDLCCGSGAVGVALAAALGGIELHAADIDPAAVRCAVRNVGPVGGVVHHGDLYDALPGSLRGRVNLLLANAPYVPTGEIGMMPPEARLFESQVALDGGPDGLDIARRVVAAAPRWLAPGGHLLVETSERQAAVLAGIVAAAELTARIEGSAEWGATVVIGTRESDHQALI